MPVSLEDIMTVLARVELRQAQHTALLSAIISGETLMSNQLDSLTQRVTEVETVQQSAVALIKGLADEIAANKDDPAALQALSDRLHASSDTLAAAVTANTPPANPPPPAP